MDKQPKQDRATVVVIDDDAEVRQALEGLFDSVGLTAETYSCVQEFVEAKRPDRPGCMVLDIRLPGQSGLDYQAALAKTGVTRAIVLISGHADVPMSVRAMKAGAVDVLTKPVHEQELLDAVQRAIEQDATRRIAATSHTLREAKFATMTERERQVMTLVVTGLPNKQVAAALAVAEATVKLHRGQVMRKLEAKSLAELVRIADLLQLEGSKKGRG